MDITRNRALAAAAAVVATSLLTMIPAAPAQAGGRLGPVDMQKACRTQAKPGGQFLFEAKWTKYNDPYSWKCQPIGWTPIPMSFGIDMNRACRDQYPGKGAYAGLAARNVLGWYCQN